MLSFHLESARFLKQLEVCNLYFCYKLFLAQAKGFFVPAQCCTSQPQRQEHFLNQPINLISRIRKIFIDSSVEQSQKAAQAKSMRGSSFVEISTTILRCSDLFTFQATTFLKQVVSKSSNWSCVGLRGNCAVNKSLKFCYMSYTVAWYGKLGPQKSLRVHCLLASYLTFLFKKWCCFSRHRSSLVPDPQKNRSQTYVVAFPKFPKTI